VLLTARGTDAMLKQRILDTVKYQPDLASLDTGTVARRLGLGPRTLRHRLAGLNVSPIKEIASRLGYSEQSAFQRAFKRWTGMTPGQYRASMLPVPVPVPRLPRATSESGYDGRYFGPSSPRWISVARTTLSRGGASAASAGSAR